MNKRLVIYVTIAIVVIASVLAIVIHFTLANRVTTAQSSSDVAQPVQETVPVLDVADYDLRMQQLAHAVVSAVTASDPAVIVPVPLWPAQAVYPNVGALLPFHRIVAYYGNFYSKGMGILGQYATDEVITRLQGEVATWNEADPTMPVIPAIDYIAVTAQASPGKDGKYRLRMPDSQIQKAIDLAKQVDGIVILEVQAGLSDMMTEVQKLEPFLSLPKVHLAIDPEFAMVKSGRRPGAVVGTVDATTLNAAADYLAALVKEHNLPPKLLIVHRYTRAMVTNADEVTPLPEVQFVMDMDGWGPPAQKLNTYQAYIYSEPVQFTGFKLFYRNDVRRAGSRLLTPAEVLDLVPQPSFIQYQ